jgi:hypothetical protein
MVAHSPLRLVIEKGPLAGTEVSLDADRSITIGRRQGVDLLLTGDDFVSMDHAEIVATSAGMLLRNQSANGTLLNGRPVDEALLAAGDRISVGLVHLVSVKGLPAALPKAPVVDPRTAPQKPAQKPRQPGGTAGKTAAAPTGNRRRLPLPAWLIAYFAVMVVLAGFLGYVKIKGRNAPGLPEIQAQEQQYAASRKWPQEETARILRLLETATVHERRGDPRSAFEAYREALGVRVPIDPRSPAYKYAAGRIAVLGPK